MNAAQIGRKLDRLFPGGGVSDQAPPLEGAFLDLIDAITEGWDSLPKRLQNRITGIERSFNRRGVHFCLRLIRFLGAEDDIDDAIREVRKLARESLRRRPKHTGRK